MSIPPNIMRLQKIQQARSASNYPCYYDIEDFVKMYDYSKFWDLKKIVFPPKK